MRTPAAETIFWVCLVGVVYHYAGYPVLLFILSQASQAKADLLYLIRRTNRRCFAPSKNVPQVAVLISAYNEALVIREKVENCLQIDYPADRLEFLFGLDAPTDSTAECLDQIKRNRVRVFEFSDRRGKLAVLRDLAQRTSADILVFTDANTMLERNCIRNMVRHFADARVGAVSGEEVRTVSRGTDPGAESMYWRYESAIKVLESRLNCSLGGNGAALAVRRSLFQGEEQSVVEDFQIPLEIRYKGFRVLYDPEVIATEEIAATFAAQFARRVRIAAGSYQTLFRHPGYLNPSKGLLAVCFFSHRLLRWLGPFLLLVALCSSVRLAAQREFAIAVAFQCVFYSMALTGYFRKKHGQPAGLFSLPLYFCSMNLALLFGLYACLSGRQGLVWQATPRRSQPEIEFGSLVDHHAGAEGANPALQRPAA